MVGLFRQLKITDIVVAAFTLMLVWVGHQANAVSRSQRNITAATIVISRQQREIMSRQADTAEQAMTIGDWPHALVKTPFIRSPVTSHSATWPPSAIYECAFKGRTPAILRSVQDTIIFRDSLPLLSEIELGAVYHDQIVEDGSVRTEETQMAMDVARLSEEEMFCRTESMKSYYVIGRVVYDDLFGHTHELIFCYQSDRQGGRGAIAGGTAYNYRCTRKQGEPEQAGSPKEHPQPGAIQPAKQPLRPGWGLVDGKPTQILT
jgi:hypothetical protein